MHEAGQFLGGVLSGLLGGLLSGAFGIGGGIVLVPLLALLLHLDQHRAQGVTLAAMLLPIGLPAVLHYRQRGLPIHWRVLGWMMAGFLPGILVGAWTANLIPARPLRWCFAGFLVLLALRSLSRRKAGAAAGPARPGWAAPVLIGAAGGLASGLLGIGGGVVMIPLLAWALGMGQQEAQLQSLLLLLPPLGLPGVIVYAAAQGGLPWLLLGGVALGFAGGAAVGARAATRVETAHLEKAFALLLLATALILVWRS